MILNDTAAGYLRIGVPARQVDKKIRIIFLLKVNMKKNVLVTATGGRSVGSGILHALIRSSKDVAKRWNIIAADADPFAWGLYVAPSSVLLPLASDPFYLERLDKIIKQKKIQAVIPGSEPELNLLSVNTAHIKVPIIANGSDLMPLMMDKFRVIEKVKELGLPVIETWPILQWKKAILAYDYPFIIKPTVGSGGSRGLKFVTSANEIEVLIPSISNPENYCIQPYIGSGKEEYTVGVLSDKQGKLIDSIVMKRELIGISLLESRKLNGNNFTISTGYSQGYFIKNKKIQSFCEELSSSIKSRGPLNIQCRIMNGKIYVFEIHPRFSGTSPIRADVGFNEPDLLLRNFLYDEKFSRLRYRYNVAAVRAFEHVIVPVSKMKKR